MCFIIIVTFEHSGHFAVSAVDPSVKEGLQCYITVGRVAGSVLAQLRTELGSHLAS